MGNLETVWMRDSGPQLCDSAFCGILNNSNGVQRDSGEGFPTVSECWIGRRRTWGRLGRGCWLADRVNGVGGLGNHDRGR